MISASTQPPLHLGLILAKEGHRALEIRLRSGLGDRMENEETPVDNHSPVLVLSQSERFEMTLPQFKFGHLSI